MWVVWVWAVCYVFVVSVTMDVAVFRVCAQGGVVVGGTAAPCSWARRCICVRVSLCVCVCIRFTRARGGGGACRVCRACLPSRAPSYAQIKNQINSRARARAPRRCPVFGELPYVPGLAFPFVKVFQRDDLAAFEALLAVLLNFAGGWVETYPHAPLVRARPWW